MSEQSLVNLTTISKWVGEVHPHLLNWQQSTTSITGLATRQRVPKRLQSPQQVEPPRLGLLLRSRTCMMRRHKSVSFDRLRLPRLFLSLGRGYFSPGPSQFKYQKEILTFLLPEANNL